MIAQKLLLTFLRSAWIDIFFSYRSIMALSFLLSYCSKSVVVDGVSKYFAREGSVTVDSLRKCVSSSCLSG